MPQAGRTPELPKPKDQRHFTDLYRFPLHSYYRSRLAAAGVFPKDGVFQRLRAFLSSNPLPWIAHVAKYFFNPRYAFQDYTNPAIDNGTYRFPDESPTRISIAGDWGTGTLESETVAESMRASGSEPDYTIHLGDVYYVGDQAEIYENCLGKPTSSYKPVMWPLGTSGSFALNGNHEMYANGTSYFRDFLPRLGARQPGSTKLSGQGASFFCLYNRYWKIIGLDTGYNSLGPTLFSWIPAVNKIKWLRETSWFKPSCALEDKLLTWVKKHVKPSEDKRGIILLSHHQYYSAFDDWYVRPAKQLMGIIDRPVLWFWGHEHRLAIYDLYGVRDGIKAYGRCIGHGGMPVTVGEKPFIDDCPLRAFDDRVNENATAPQVGYNGFVNLMFSGNRLDVRYLDLNNKTLTTETWTVDVDKGALLWSGLENVDPGLTQP